MSGWFRHRARERRAFRRRVEGAFLAQDVKRRLAIETVRKYVKQVFAKTGTNRQAALVTLVLSSLVTMQPED
jgi:DNA-binding CsgD family transcriptional regulator